MPLIPFYEAIKLIQLFRQPSLASISLARSVALASLTRPVCQWLGVEV